MASAHITTAPNSPLTQLVIWEAGKVWDDGLELIQEDINIRYPAAPTVDNLDTNAGVGDGVLSLPPPRLLDLTIKTLKEEYDDVAVVSGVLSGFPNETAPRAVECKVMYLEPESGVPNSASELGGMLYEAQLYRTELKSVAGVLVPHFYGVFRGPRTLCMVLENCGKRVKKLAHSSCEIRCTSSTIFLIRFAHILLLLHRAQCMSILWALHKQRLYVPYHSRRFVRDRHTGRIRLVGFETAESGHECKSATGLDRIPVFVTGYKAMWDLCPELRDAGLALRLWARRQYL